MTNQRAGRTHLVTAASVVLTLSPRPGLLEILASLGQGLLELHDLLDLLLPGQLQGGQCELSWLLLPWSDCRRDLPGGD